MKNNTILPNGKNEPKAPNELLATTALLYFKEALVNQQYEQCAGLIRTAKRFGVRQADINKVIAEYTNKGKAGGVNEALNNIGGRLRFLKEE